jgi:hypothetical protein
MTPDLDSVSHQTVRLSRGSHRAPSEGACVFSTRWRGRWATTTTATTCALTLVDELIGIDAPPSPPCRPMSGAPDPAARLDVPLRP